MSDLYSLPEGLPIPIDDGLCNHLIGMKLPATRLASTSGEIVDLSNLDKIVVLYCFPMIGDPSVPLPFGWDEIPGARGCTPQSCTFRDHYREFEEKNILVYGLSTQTTQKQKQAVERLHLPFDLLSDETAEFSNNVNLPKFTIGDEIFTKRITLVIENSVVKKTFYPIFPPDKHIYDVLDWTNEFVR